MATITNDILEVQRPLGGVPYGNLSALPFEMEVLEGVFTDSDDATALVATDKVILGTIPAGFKVLDALLSVNEALGDTGCTLDIGFEYVDGVDVTATPEDPDHFFDGADPTGAIRAAMSTVHAPFVFPKDAYLTVLVVGAAFLTTTSLTGKVVVNLIGICDQG